MTSGAARRTSVTELAPEPRSAPRARALVRELLSGTLDDGLVDRLQQCVTELVTNAVLHAGTPVRVQLHESRAGVRLEVHDGSTNVPVLSPHTPTASTGRGLGMVATLSDAWGVEVRGGGKVVWCEISSVGAHTDGAHTDVQDDVLAARGLSTDEANPVAPAAPPAPGQHPVILFGYPVGLGQRLQEHYESVVRECQLVASPRAPGAAPLPPRLLELASFLAERYLTDLAQLARPDTRRIAAQSQGLESVDLDFWVSREELTLLVSGQRILDDVDEFAARGDLLAPTIAPDLALLRNWALREFLRQSEGAAPRPWSAVRSGVDSPVESSGS